MSDGLHNYTYDAENRMISVDGGNTATYVYDADGHRVQKTSATGNYSDPAGTWIFFYDQSGRWVQKFNSPGNTFVQGHIFAAGRHLASVGGWTTFSHSDWVGTERFRTYMSGIPYQTESCTSLPFGDGLNCTGSDVDPLHFTGKERDSESGLDYFGARYNSSSLGRFMSPDPENAGAVIDAPQSWNAYSYVLNNPLNLIDPQGLDCVYLDNNGGTDPDGPGGFSVDHNSTQAECESKENGGTWLDGTIAESSVFADPNSNWVSGIDQSGTKQSGCNGNSDQCSEDAFSSFFGDTQKVMVPGTGQLFETDEQRLMTLNLAGEEAGYYLGCVAPGFLVGSVGPGLWKAGQPVAGSKPFRAPGTTKGTSPASQFLRDSLKGKKLPVRVGVPVGGPTTGTPFKIAKGVSAGATAGRLVPWVGAAATVYGTYELYKCINSKP